MTPVQRIIGGQIDRRGTPTDRHGEDTIRISDRLRGPRPMIRAGRGEEGLLPRLAIVLRGQNACPMPHDDKCTDLRLRFEVTTERNALADLDVLRRFIRGEDGRTESEKRQQQGGVVHVLGKRRGGWWPDMQCKFRAPATRLSRSGRDRGRVCRGGG